MIALHSNKYILYYIISLCFLLANACAPRKRPKNIFPKVLKPQENTSSTLNYYLTETSHPAVNPKDLTIFRAHVAHLQLGKILIPKIIFGTSPKADYVSWEVCPNTLDKKCIKGKTYQSEIFVGPLEADTYTISLKSCVYKERSSDSSKICGSTSLLKWKQVADKNRERHALIEELFLKDQELRALGAKLYSVLNTFKKQLSSCNSDEKDKFTDKINKEIAIQIENLLSLGPDFVASAIMNTNFSDSGEELVPIIEPMIVKEENTNFDPNGLSLFNRPSLDAHKLSKYYEKHRISIIEQNSYFSQKDITSAILGSSGIAKKQDSFKLNSPTKPFTTTEFKKIEKKEFQKLSVRQKASIFAGFLTTQNSLSLSQNSDLNSLAESEFIRSFLWIKKPSKLNECLAYTNTEVAIENIRSQGLQIKKRMLEIKGLLEN